MKLFWICAACLIAPITFASGEYSNGAIGFSIETPQNWQQFINPEQGAGKVPIVYYANKRGETEPESFTAGISVFFVPLSVFKDEETGRYTEVHLKQQALLKPEILSQTELVGSSGLTRFHTRTKFEIQIEKKMISFVQEFLEIHRDGFAFLIVSSVPESADSETKKEVQSAIESISIAKFTNHTFPAHKIAQKLGVVEMVNEQTELGLKLQVPEDQVMNVDWPALTECLKEQGVQKGVDLYSVYAGDIFESKYEETLDFLGTSASKKFLPFLYDGIFVASELKDTAPEPNFSDSEITIFVDYLTFFNPDDKSAFSNAIRPDIFINQYQRLALGACTVIKD